MIFFLIFYLYGTIKRICKDKDDNMHKKHYSIIAYFISISLLFVILITSIRMNAFQHSFYERMYENLQTATTAQVPQEDLMKATTVLLDYLEDKRDDLQVEIHRKGNVNQAFNAKEILHMEDVKQLYQGSLTIYRVCLYGMLIGILYLGIRLKKGVFSYLALRFVKTALYFFLFVAFLGAYAIIDFDSFWTSFHYIFFSNDLWLLNPATDFMILMFPEQLFFQLVLRIIACFSIGMGSIFVLCLYFLKREVRAFTTRSSLLLERMKKK